MLARWPNTEVYDAKYVAYSPKPIDVSTHETSTSPVPKLTHGTGCRAAAPYRTVNPTPTDSTAAAISHLTRNDSTASTPCTSPVSSGAKRTIATAATTHTPITAPSASERGSSSRSPRRRWYPYTWSSAPIATRVAADSSQSVTPSPIVSHQSCFWLSTCLTVSSTSLNATSEACFLNSGATSLFQTSSRWRKPSTASRKSRNGTSAKTTRNAIALAKVARPCCRKAPTTSLVSA